MNAKVIDDFVLPTQFLKPRASVPGEGKPWDKNFFPAWKQKFFIPLSSKGTGDRGFFAKIAFFLARGFFASRLGFFWLKASLGRRRTGPF
jgi:hypothetical protein